MIVVINGSPRSGKSTFVELCKEAALEGQVYEYSTVDFVKELALHAGWDGSKTPSNRKFLSDLKDLLTEWNDVPFKKTVEAIQRFNYEAVRNYRHRPDKIVIFIHCREPEQIQRFKDYFGDECMTLLIRRAAVESDDQSNDSDRRVLDYNYDKVIVNDSDLIEFGVKAEEFLYFLKMRDR